MTQNLPLSNASPITHSDWQVLREQAQMLLKSGFLPKSVDTTEKAIAIILTGRELGIPAMTALRTIDVINQKPTVSPQLMLGLINASGQLENIEIIETRNGQGISCTMKRKGKTAHTEIFGFEEANKLGLTGKDNYKRQPLTIFRWRAVAACARVVFPDVVLGLYTADEMGGEVEFTPDGEIAEQPLREVSNNVVLIAQNNLNPETGKIRAEIAEICDKLNYSIETKDSVLAKFDSLQTDTKRIDALSSMKGKLSDYQKLYPPDDSPKNLRDSVTEQPEKLKLSPRELKAIQIFESLKDGGEVKLTVNGDGFVLFAPNDADEWQDFVISHANGKTICDCSPFKSLSKQKPEFLCEHINSINRFMEYQAAMRETA